MLKIKNNTELYLTRGDSVQMQITIIDASGDPYTPETGDVIRFALKKTYQSAEPEILKTLNNNNLVLTLTPEETKEQEILRKEYIVAFRAQIRGQLDNIKYVEDLSEEELAEYNRKKNQ